jgi:ATP-dependent Clp protease protease subunit
MASEEARFIARADRLAGPRGVAAVQAQNRYVLPQFSEKTPYGMKTQDPYTKLFEDRIIFMGVQVDDTSADDIMAQLLVLESQDPNRDVMIYINSPGGSMTAMTAIYDTMQLIHQPAIDQGFGKATEIEIQAKEMLRMRTWLENTLAKHTGQDVERIRKDIEVDTFLTAEDAKSYGIVDAVLEHRK